MNSTLCHSGIIQSINGDFAIVRILSAAACQSCSMKKNCMQSEQSEKEIRAKLPPNRTFHTGQEVNVQMQTRLGILAIFWAYILPFILILCVLIMGNLFLVEWISILIVFIILGLYYTLLYLLRERIGREFHFEVSSF